MIDKYGENYALMTEDVIKRHRQLQHVLQRVVPMLWRMRRYGMPLGPADPEFNVCVWKERKFRERIAELKNGLYELVGFEFNMRSYGKNGQFNKFLYGQEGLGKYGVKPLMAHGKQRADKYAINRLQYEYRDNPEVAKILGLLSEIRRRVHRYDNFIAKLLVMKPCDCKKGQRFKCHRCAGTGNLEFIGYNDQYCTVRDGHVYVHITHLQNQLTLRIGHPGYALGTTPRKDEDFGIPMRDMWTVPPGDVFWEMDWSKAEARFAAIVSGDPNLIDEVNRPEALTEFAARVFNIDPNMAVKGSKYYTYIKIIKYATLNMGNAQTLHDIFMTAHVYYPVKPDCQEFIKVCRRRYKVYYEWCYNGAWQALQRRWWATYWGHRFLATVPDELLGVRHWRDIEFGSRGWFEFNEFTKLWATTNIQGGATGFGLQLAFLRCQDASDLKLNPNWSEDRLNNGRWDVFRPHKLTHDSIMGSGKIEIVEQHLPFYEENFIAFGKFNDYLPLGVGSELDFGFRAETTVTNQWEVDHPANWRDMTEDKNANDFYKSYQGTPIRFRL